MERNLPQRTDGLAQPFFDGCREGVLRLQHCGACGHWQFYPRPFCVACGAEPGWGEVSGSARIASYTVVRRPLSPAYEAPYVVALVDLAEGPRLMMAIVGCEPEAVAVGAAVAIDFENWSDSISLPVCRLTEKGGTS